MTAKQRQELERVSRRSRSRNKRARTSQRGQHPTRSRAAEQLPSPTGAMLWACVRAVRQWCNWQRSRYRSTELTSRLRQRVLIMNLIYSR